MTETNITVNKKETMDKRDLARLVDYYRMRVEGFEKERIEWLEKLEGLRLSHEEHHRMEWELRRRTDEIIELQNALSESNVSLNQERKQIIHLTHELDNMKLRSKEDRRRLIQLLQLAEPIEQTIKLYYDRRPEKLEKFASTGAGFNNFSNYDHDSVALKKSLGVSTGKQTPNQGLLSSTLSSKNPNMIRHKSISSKRLTSAKTTKKTQQSVINNNINIFAPKLEYRIPPSDEKQQVVRTILLPNEETDTSLKEENEFLRKELNEMRSLYENQIFKMEEDRRLRDEESRLRDLNFREKIEDMTKRNQKLDKLNYESTKDYMQLKYDSSNNEKKLYEELEMVKLQNEALSVSLKELLHRSSVDKEINKNDYERKTKEITSVMRTQVKTQEENNNIIKEQYKQIQKIYTGRVKELEDKLKSLTEKYKSLENKRNFEIEGYINEIVLMRKRLKSYEEYVSKVRNMYYGDTNQIENVDHEEVNKKLQEMSQTNDDLYNLRNKLKEDYQMRNSNNTGLNENQSNRNDSQNNYNSYSQNNNENYDEEKSGVAMEDL